MSRGTAQLITDPLLAFQMAVILSTAIATGTAHIKYRQRKPKTKAPRTKNPTETSIGGQSITDIKNAAKEAAANKEPSTPPGTKPLNPKTKNKTDQASAYARPGEPNYNGTPTQGEPHPDPRQWSPPDQNIHASALQAANWIATHWEDDAATIGYATLVAQQTARIEVGDFDQKYFTECKHEATFAECSIPTNTLDPIQQAAPFGDPNRRRSITKYTTVTTRYDIPAPNTNLPSPSPGYKGETEDAQFKDRYSCAQCDIYKLPRPYKNNTFIPLFAASQASITVNSTKRPTKLHFSVRTKSVLHTEDDPNRYDAAAMPAQSRFWEYHRPMPAGGATGFNGSISPNYIIDLNVKTTTHNNGATECTHVAFKQTTATSNGKYFADSDTITTQFTATTRVYQANLPPTIASVGFNYYDAWSENYQWTRDYPAPQWNAFPYIDATQWVVEYYKPLAAALPHINYRQQLTNATLRTPQGSEGLNHNTPPDAFLQPGYLWFPYKELGPSTGNHGRLLTTLLFVNGYRAISLPGHSSEQDFANMPLPPRSLKL